MRNWIVTVLLAATTWASADDAPAGQRSGPVVPDVLAVEIETAGAREVGSATTFYALFIGVEGQADLTDVSVTPPGGAPIVLDFDPEEEIFFVELGFYTSLAALRADYPLGDYLFEFNGGASSILLDYPDLEPACFAGVTAPDRTCPVSPTPTLIWTLPGGCSAGAVDVGLENLSADEALFDLSFIPASGGSIELPDGPVVPDPFEPLPPLSPLVPGDLYILGVDVVEGRFTTESVGADSFDYQASFRNDFDARFLVSGVGTVLALQIDRDSLGWECATAEAIGIDVVRGDLGLLRGNAGDFAVATAGCLANDAGGTSLANGEDPPGGAGTWYLVREATVAGNGSYISAGPGEVAARDAAIAASGADCP